MAAEEDEEISFDDAFTRAVACQPGDPAAVNDCLNDAKFIAAIDKFIHDNDISVGKVVWPTRKGVSTKATPAWMLNVDDASFGTAMYQGSQWRISIRTGPLQTRLLKVCTLLILSVCQRLRSEMASDPAEAAELVSRSYLCR